VRPDRTGCLHPLTNTVSNSELPCSIDQYAEQLTCNYPRMARGTSESPVNV